MSDQIQLLRQVRLALQGGDFQQAIDAGEIKTEQGRTFVHVRLPQAPEQYTHSQVIFHFAGGGRPVETRKVKH